jgi:coenzyme F420-0:L-glutamate ligase / coenzyme F420-1:gamma-L-glutamate ligase
MTPSPNPDHLARFAAHRVARLATVGPDGTPALVPVCFALLEFGGEPTLAIALDEKPKAVAAGDLARVRNIRERPAVALLADEWDEDWSRLAWVRVRGRARLAEPGAPGHAEAVAALRGKYAQYRSMGIDRQPAILVGGLRTRSWSGAKPEAEAGTGVPPEPAPRPRPGRDGLEALLRGRRSVRAFRPDPVPRAVVAAAIEAAGWAPSPHGRQPWRFAVVEAVERRFALAAAMAETWEQQLRLDGQDEVTVAHRLARSRERLETAPVLVIPCLYLDDLDAYPDPARQEAERTMAVQSLGAAVQNLLLSVYAAGLDAGWMCAPLFCPDVVRAALGLAPALHPHALVPVGYAAKDPVRRPRRSLDDLVVSWT